MTGKSTAAATEREVEEHNEMKWNEMKWNEMEPKGNEMK
jgi:hypothetical protein